MIFWGVIPCSQIEILRRFGGTHCFHFQSRKLKQASNQQDSDNVLAAAYSQTTKSHIPEDRAAILFNITLPSTSRFLK
jgi:hypothetical protein